MRRLTILTSLGVFLFASTGTPAALDHDTTKLQIEHSALQYFRDHTNPVTGMVRDSADNFHSTPASNTVASIAATGFGLAVVANASLDSRKLVTRDYAYAYALRTLKFSRDHLVRRKGWFLHWVDWNTGVRAWDCEYSTIDSALFIAGALYAAQVFPGTEVAAIAHQLYEEMDFYDAMTDGGTKPNKRTLSMAYLDGVGYTPSQWDLYAEEKILLILGLGHPTHPLPPETWVSWNRWPAAGPVAVHNLMGLDQALFVHQYSELYIDFRHFKDANRNYFKNGNLVSHYQRRMLNGSLKYNTMRAGFWGFSAGEAPNNVYRVYSATNYTSTVCIGCIVGSAMFMPEEVLEDVTNWVAGPYGPQIWGTYGLADSIDLDQNFFAQDVIGITVGPEFLSLANTSEDTSVWKKFMEIPEIQNGIKAAEAADLRANLPPDTQSVEPFEFDPVRF